MKRNFVKVIVMVVILCMAMTNVYAATPKAPASKPKVNVAQAEPATKADTATNVKVAEKSIPILCYHLFSEKETNDGVTMQLDLFEKQLKAIKDAGYTTITASEYYAGNLPKKPIMITVDDGYIDNYTLMFPLLKKYEMKATIFIVTSSVGKTPGNVMHFTWEQAKEMEESGLVEIGCHGLIHFNHAIMNEHDLKSTLKVAMDDIEEHLGERKVKTFAYPYMSDSDQSNKWVQELGFNMVFTDPDVTSGTDFFKMRRYGVPVKISAEDLIAKIK